MTHSTSSPRRLASLYRSSVGRKFVLAVSGVAIVGFVLAHLIGTMKIYLGPDSTNDYGEALRDLGGPLAPRSHLLWTLRLGLIGAFAVHLHAALTLHRRNRRAAGKRDVSSPDYIAATYASRTMLWSGVIVGLFIVFHLADLTWGTVHPDFVRGDAYNNQITSFRNPWTSAVYVIGVAAMTNHLFHGLWSLFRSLGASTQVLSIVSRRAAAAVAVAIGVGYVSVPIAVLLRVLDYSSTN